MMIYIMVVVQKVILNGFVSIELGTVVILGTGVVYRKIS